MFFFISDEEISIVVDINWRDYYIDRKDHPLEAAENVIFDADNKVVRIGKILTSQGEKNHATFSEKVNKIEK